MEIISVTAENEKVLLEAESKQMRSLMGNVAHDLKTPLHSIQAEIDMLRVYCSSIPLKTRLEIASVSTCIPAKDIKYLDTIFASLDSTCRFMTMAINRSQDYMKASSNIALVPCMGTFHIIVSLTIATSCINNLYSGTRRAIIHPFSTEICPYIISDKHWLIENVLCLLSNAMKYSDDGDADVYIELETVENHSPHHVSEKSVPSKSDVTDKSDIRGGRGTIIVAVEDRGVGVPESVRNTLFQPFQQAQRLAGGTGLGLYSLSKRIEALGGTCGIKSRRDNEPGSQFWFSFPYRPDESAIDLDEKDGDQFHLSITTSSAASFSVRDDESQTILSRSSVDTSQVFSDSFTRRSSILSTNALGDIKPLSLLLVDDTMSILKVTGRMLTMNQHKVQTAVNGMQGLTKLKQSYIDNDGQDQFDACISDLQMP